MEIEKVKVLLVEDDEDDYVLTRGLLSEIDEDRFLVEWAPTYEGGLERILRNNHDVCLLDFRLGSRDGLELLREAREQGCKSPIILLTGQGDRETDLQAMKAGAADYLVKAQLNAALLERSIRYAVAQKSRELEQLQLALEKEARAQAEAASKAKDEFLAMVSHELRTPLNAMLGWVVLLRGGQLDEASARQGLETIERNAKSQDKLIGDLLDVSRIVSGNLRLELRQLELAPIIDAALAAIRPAAEAKGIRIESSLEPQDVMLGDPNRLLQVLGNLLSNAVKFTPEGGSVAVSMARAGPNIEITVSDTGAGITPEFLPHVFGRFRQADTTTSRTHGGLGLGLAIVSHLVELHGGSVRAESPGQGLGSTFTVTLPLLNGY